MPGLRKKDEVSQEQNQREEDYEKLFPKIGRDFVSKEDLADILALIVNAIPGLSVEVSDAKATALAAEYKDNINSGKTDSKKYKDLIKLDDDDEPEESEDEEEEEDSGSI